MRINVLKTTDRKIKYSEFYSVCLTAKALLIARII